MSIQKTLIWIDTQVSLEKQAIISRKTDMSIQKQVCPKNKQLDQGKTNNSLQIYKQEHNHLFSISFSRKYKHLDPENKQVYP